MSDGNGSGSSNKLRLFLFCSVAASFVVANWSAANVGVFVVVVVIVAVAADIVELFSCCCVDHDEDDDDEDDDDVSSTVVANVSALDVVGSSVEPEVTAAEEVNASAVGKSEAVTTDSMSAPPIRA